MRHGRESRGKRVARGGGGGGEGAFMNENVPLNKTPRKQV